MHIIKYWQYITMLVLALVQNCWAESNSQLSEGENGSLNAIVSFISDASSVVVPMSQDQQLAVESFIVQYFSQTQVNREMLKSFRDGYNDALNMRGSLKNNLSNALFPKEALDEIEIGKTHYYLLGIDFALFLGTPLDFFKLEETINDIHELNGRMTLVNLVSAGILEHARMNSRLIVVALSHKGFRSTQPSHFYRPLATFPFYARANVKSYDNVRCIIYAEKDSIQIIDETAVEEIPNDLRTIYRESADQDFKWHHALDILKIMLIESGRGAYIIFYK